MTDSDSDHAALDELRKQHDFERRTSEMRKARREAIRGWSQWALTITLAVLALYDKVHGLFTGTKPP